MVHLLKNGFGLQVAHDVGGGTFLRQSAPQFDEGDAFKNPSSHCSLPSTIPSPHLGGGLWSHSLHSVVQLL